MTATVRISWGPTTPTSSKLLHAHHEAEDLTIFPMMMERLPEDLELLSRVNGEHEAVLGRLDIADQAVAAWRAHPSSASRDAAAAALASLQTILLQHLDHEEADVVPLIGLCINVAEWGEMSATAFRLFSGDKVWLVVGLIQEQMLDQENATMEANMPPPCATSGSARGAGCSRTSPRSCGPDPGGQRRCPVPGWSAWWTASR